VSVDRQQLMALFDDELPELQARRLTRDLGGDPDGAEYFESLELVGQLVRKLTDERLLRAPDLTDAIMARIAAADAAPPPRPVKPARWHTVAPAVGVALAVAAAVALVVHGGDRNTPAHRNLALSRPNVVVVSASTVRAPPELAPTAATPAEVYSAVAEPELPAIALAPVAKAPRKAARDFPEASALASNEPRAAGVGAAPGVSIENVDFGPHNGAIFVVSSGTRATPVVWLSDPPDETRARIKSL
jgi:hypothetical protein